MNWLDLILLLVIVLSVITSFRKGLTRELIGLASIILGLLLGAWFYGSVAGFLARYLTSRATANFAGFLIIFFGVVLLGAIVRAIVGKFLRVTGLSFFDHLLGAGFGVLRGVLIGVALLMAILAFSPGDRPPRSVEESRLAPYVSSAARLFVAMAPKELRDGFHKAYARAQEAWKHGVAENIHSATRAEKGKQ
jgi:membrane protein required for colicin V production